MHALGERGQAPGQTVKCWQQRNGDGRAGRAARELAAGQPTGLKIKKPYCLTILPNHIVAERPKQDEREELRLRQDAAEQRRGPGEGWEKQGGKAAAAGGAGRERCAARRRLHQPAALQLAARTAYAAAAPAPPAACACTHSSANSRGREVALRRAASLEPQQRAHGDVRQQVDNEAPVACDACDAGEAAGQQRHEDLAAGGKEAEQREAAGGAGAAAAADGGGWRGCCPSMPTAVSLEVHDVEVVLDRCGHEKLVSQRLARPPARDGGRCGLRARHTRRSLHCGCFRRDTGRCGAFGEKSWELAACLRFA